MSYKSSSLGSYIDLTLIFFPSRHLILSCQGHLRIFPFDDPLCSFAMESSKYCSASIQLTLILYLKKREKERSYHHQLPFLSPSLLLLLLLYESLQQYMIHVHWKIRYEVIPVYTLLHKNATLIENKNINTFQETEIEL